jgi:membrane protein YqaA with SNARE-associated domain
MSRCARIQVSVRVVGVRIGGRRGGWLCAGLLVFVLAAAMAGRAQAQTAADPEIERLTAAAEQGDAAAQVKLGMHYYTGRGRRSPPDYAEALKWFRLAADQGNAEAQDRIGMMYYAGRGVAQDYAEAARWYRLAAQQGNEHAQSQLMQMYQGGVGVPRDYQESKKWARALKAKHPDKTAIGALLLLGIGLVAVLAFSFGLVALQRNRLVGWGHVVVAVLVHAAGIALVLNSVTTYGFLIVFHNCAHNFLATDCTQISDPQTRKIVNEIGDWAIVNLIFRFMAGIGLVLDILAGWYLVYVLRRCFGRSSRPARFTPAEGIR